MQIREDSWLSERFGHPVFSVRSAEGLREHATAQGRASYQARVDTRDVETVAGLEDVGMRVVNTTVTLCHDLVSSAPVSSPSEVTVRGLDAARDASLPDLAGRCFEHNRFHLDPAIPKDVADRVKRDWVLSYLDGVRGDELLVALRDNEQVGFLAVLVREQGANAVGVIDLIGVAPEAQGRGVGSALVERFHEWSSTRCEAVEVGTQVANQRATAFYERLGYVTTRSAYDLHMHVG